MQGSQFTYYLKLFGFSPKKFIYSLKGTIPYLRNLSRIKKQLRNENQFKITKLYPCLDDRYEDAGILAGHYFYMDLYVANKIFKANPQKHVDIGSRIDGFVAHVACFREIEVFDIRPFNKQINNVRFFKADLMDKNFSVKDYCDSISSLHAMEHFGLGRYGDDIDINGYLTGLTNVKKLLKQGGTFYFAVPIGNQRIEFDAHRVFSLKYLISLFEKDYEIKSFAYIDDNEILTADAVLSSKSIEDNFNCNFGCGIFELIKK